jgi:hypothetical protein
MKKRKEIENYIIDHINKIDPSGTNGDLYKKMFKDMTDKEFDALMKKLEKEEVVLQMIASDGKKDLVDLDRNFSIAKDFGVSFFQKIYNKDGDTEYLSPQENLVYDLPVRRTRQTLLKGLSYAENSKKRNPLTKQVTSSSKGGKITYPEVQILHGLGMENTLKELMNVRGGNVTAANARRAYIHKYGIVKREDIEKFGGMTGATKTLETFWKSAHIKMKGV